MLITVIILALCVGGTVLFIPIFKQRSDESARIAQLQQEIAKQKATYLRQTRETEQLKNNPEYVEMIARDRLDLMKPGETIIRLEPARAATVATPAPPGKN